MISDCYAQSSFSLFAFWFEQQSLSLTSSGMQNISSTMDCFNLWNLHSKVKEKGLLVALFRFPSQTSPSQQLVHTYINCQCVVHRRPFGFSSCLQQYRREKKTARAWRGRRGELEQTRWYTVFCTDDSIVDTTPPNPPPPPYTTRSLSCIGRQAL